MDASKEARLKALTEAIAALLYEETATEAVTRGGGMGSGGRGLVGVGLIPLPGTVSGHFESKIFEL
jgi:hypothetical protein